MVIATNVFTMFYSMIALPFGDMKSNIILMIEEVGTLVSVLLLVFIKIDYKKETTGEIVIYILGGIILVSMVLEIFYLVINIM